MCDPSCRGKLIQTFKRNLTGDGNIVNVCGRLFGLILVLTHKLSQSCSSNRSICVIECSPDNLNFQAAANYLTTAILCIKWYSIVMVEREQENFILQDLD